MCIIYLISVNCCATEAWSGRSGVARLHTVFATPLSCRYCWWESVVTLRKLLIAVLVVFLHGLKNEGLELLVSLSRATISVPGFEAVCKRKHQRRRRVCEVETSTWSSGRVFRKHVACHAGNTTPAREKTAKGHVIVVSVKTLHHEASLWSSAGLNTAWNAFQRVSQ